MQKAVACLQSCRSMEGKGGARPLVPQPIFVAKTWLGLEGCLEDVANVVLTCSS